MQPKVNNNGGKSINVISTQTGRSLHISLQLMTWGIADYVNDMGIRWKRMSLNFPNNDYKTPGTDEFLKKLTDFENQIIDDAVKHSDAWFERSLRGVVKYNFPLSSIRRIS